MSAADSSKARCRTPQRADNLVVGFTSRSGRSGTGLTAERSEDVEQIHRFIRDILTVRFSSEGTKIRILYGGSVKPSNAAELMGCCQRQRCAWLAVPA